VGAQTLRRRCPPFFVNWDYNSKYLRVRLHLLVVLVARQSGGRALLHKVVLSSTVLA